MVVRLVSMSSWIFSNLTEGGSGMAAAMAFTATEGMTVPIGGFILKVTSARDGRLQGELTKEPTRQRLKKERRARIKRLKD